MRKQLPQNIISSLVTNAKKNDVAMEKESSNFVWSSGDLRGVQMKWIFRN